jgi:glycerol-3-phosphate acyltransferase PlsY
VPGLLDGLGLVAGSFFAGSVPWGYLVGKASRGIDLRTVGSGGTGATNVLRTLGFKASALVFVLDFLKGVVPVLVAKSLGFEPWWVAAAAVATVAGHCWSPFIGFRGGKGVATGAGAAAGLFPQVLIVLPMMAAIVWATRYMSLGSLVAAGLASILGVGFAVSGNLDWPYALAILAMSVIIAIRHDGNIRRLLNGTERRIGETVPV